MNIYALISLLAFMVCFFLGNFIYHKNSSNQLNKMVAILCMLVGSLAFIEFLYRQAPDYESAYFWLKVSTIWPFVPSVLLHIALIFTEQKKILEKKITYIILYLPAILISGVSLSTDLLLSAALKTYWGWTYSFPHNPILFDIMSIWTILAGFSAGGLIFVYYLKSKNMLRRQAKYVFIGLYLPLIISIISDLVLPTVSVRVPEMTMTMSTIGITAISYGIWKYRFPALTTAIAADKIVSTMSNFLILLDQKGNIITQNKAASDLLGYEKNEIIGKSVDIIFSNKNEWKNLFKDDLFKDDKKDVFNSYSINNVETKIKKKNGTIVPIILSISPVLDDESKLIGLVCIGSNIEDLKEAEEKIKESLEEKEVLLKEIHHRVRNNLQIIYSLLNLQTNYIIDEKDRDLFQDSQRRVKAMAMIHEKLYGSSDLAHINFREYISGLTAYLFQYYTINPQQIELNLMVDDIILGMETAIPCGLIINELLSNSLKYAFPADKSGKIDVSLKAQGSEYILKVEDNGVGIPENVDFKKAETLGLRLVNILTEQIDGELTLINTSGTKFKLKFTEIEYEDRISVYG